MARVLGMPRPPICGHDDEGRADRQPELINSPPMLKYCFCVQTSESGGVCLLRAF